MARRTAGNTRPDDGIPLTAPELAQLTSIELGLRNESPHLARELSRRWRPLFVRHSSIAAQLLLATGAVLVAAGLVSQLVLVSLLGFVGAAVGLHAMSFRWDGSAVQRVWRWLGLEAIDGVGQDPSTPTG